MSFSLDVEADIICKVNKKQISHSLIPILQANSHTPIQHHANVCQLRKSYAYQNFSVHSNPRLIRLILGLGFCFPLTSMMIMIFMF